MTRLGELAGPLGAAPGQAAAAPAAVPDPELAQLRKELSNCVNCSSAETPEGRANIQRLRARIDALGAAAERAGTSTSETVSAEAPRRFRMNALGGFVDVQA